MTPGGTTPPTHSTGEAAPFTGLYIWDDAAAVVCVLCDTVVAQSSGLLRQHEGGAGHKKAVASATSADGTLLPADARVAEAVATLDECKAHLEMQLRAAQVVTLERYQWKAWPRSADAPHLPAVPLLSVRHESVACYGCQMACVSRREFSKKHVVLSGDRPHGDDADAQARQQDVIVPRCLCAAAAGAWKQHSGCYECAAWCSCACWDGSAS